MRKLFIFIFCSVFVLPAPAGASGAEAGFFASGDNFIIAFAPDSLSALDSAGLADFKEKTAAYGVLPTAEFNPFKDFSAVMCAEIKETPGALFCLFNSRKTMNEMVFRADFFIEGTEGEYFSKEEFFSSGALRERSGVTREQIEYLRGNTPEYPGVSGFDHPGVRFNAFLDKWHDDKTAPDPEDEKMNVYSALETEFLNFVSSYIRPKYGDGYTLITAIANERFFSVLSHEYLHVQYFMNEKFRNNVDGYCSLLRHTSEFELFVRNAIGMGYTKMKTDISLQNNEFLAFMLAYAMYEDRYATKPPFAAIMRKVLLPPQELDEISEKFFNEMYMLWAQNGWGETNHKELFRESFDIRDKYGLSDPPDATKSPFYKYLEERGTPPLIITP